ncbi:hypothetical protein BVY04_01655 [bacterium M21]|nr:hypothetical protein BVY04_01655 [bacterium M21]
MHLPINIVALKKERVISRDYRNRRIGDFLKEMHLTKGRNTGFPKIARALNHNGSPAAEFVTDPERMTFLSVIHCHPNFVGAEQLNAKQ